MFFITVALLCEAQPFIDRLGLRKEDSNYGFNIYSSEEAVLSVTGTGILNAAVSTTYLLSEKIVSDADIALNAGICGSLDRSIAKGKGFLCNRIINHSTGKEYFSDLLHPSDFKETSIESFDYPVCVSQENVKAALVDMEAAGFMESSLRFLSRDNVFCIKFVSDHAGNTNMYPSDVSGIVEKNTEAVITFIENKSKLNDIFYKKYDILSSADKELVKKISRQLRLTCSMHSKLLKLAKYCVIKSGSISVLKEYKEMSAKTKKEGKEYFRQIEQAIV